MKNIISERYKAILFHICLWGIWLYLTLSNTREEELYDRLILVSTFIILEHIPMFFINTEWLIPNILHKKRDDDLFLDFLDCHCLVQRF